MTFSLFD